MCSGMHNDMRIVMFGSDTLTCKPSSRSYYVTDTAPVPFEHRATLSTVSVFVRLFDLLRQVVGNQCLQPIPTAILNRLLVVPTFELQHVQRTAHVRIQ